MAEQQVAKAAAAEAYAEPAPRTRSLKKLILFVMLPLLIVLIVGGGAGYYFFFMGKQEEKAEEKPPPPQVFTYYTLPDMIVNLSGSNSQRLSFLKITVSLQLTSASDVGRVQSVMPRIVDNMQAYLRELRPGDLNGTAALARMRQELLNRINSTTNPVIVNDVLFQEVILQ